MIRTQIAVGVLAAVLQVPAFATAAPVSSFARLQGLLKPGDLVSITLWSEREHKGPLRELTSCSLTMVSRGERVTIGSSEIRTIKRLARAGSEPRVNADAAKSCNGAPCTAMSMALAAGTALGRAVQFLSRAPTVYRAERSAAVPACSAESLFGT